MIYKLVFLESAKKEWDRLTVDMKQLFKTKLYKILEFPYIPKNKLKGMESCYKIKLLKVGYRLIYRVVDDRVVVQVVAIGKRDKNLVYRTAVSRI